MQTRFSSRTKPERPAVLVTLGRLALLVLPAGLLLLGSLRVEGEARQVLWVGAAFQVLACGLVMLTQAFWRSSIGPIVLLLYGIGLAWSMLGQPGGTDWYPPLAQSLLVVLPLIYFARQTLRDIGAPAIRRARLMAQRLADRKDWPADLNACKTLPEVKALREALHIDAAPALALLRHPRPQVQIAALAALDFRKHWRPGQAEIVLQVALRAEEPAVRAAALTALGNIEERLLAESLAEFLRDPSPEVRRAATEALLWDTEHRWGWIRHAVRRSLGDALCADDGPLRHGGHLLTPEAVADLTAWAAEKGLLGQRAAQTLGLHYAQHLSESRDPELIEALRVQLAEPHTPPVLRMEMARLLHGNHELEGSVLSKLLDPGNPASLRLIAAEALLGEGESMEAMAALRDLARLPNREIALATADVVQRRLKVELGLLPGQPLPALHSRQATEVSRRVMAWASHHEIIEEIPVASRADNRTWHTIGDE